MLLNQSQLRAEWFEDAGILHFGSVSLIDAPIQMTHRRAIAMAQERGALISFDPNIRLPLWTVYNPSAPGVGKFLRCQEI